MLIYLYKFPPKSLFSITLILICITVSHHVVRKSFLFLLHCIALQEKSSFFACWLVFMLKGLNRFLTGFVCRSLLCHTPTQAKCSLSAVFETQWVSIGTQVAWWTNWQNHELPPWLARSSSLLNPPRRSNERNPKISRKSASRKDKRNLGKLEGQVWLFTISYSEKHCSLWPSGKIKTRQSYSYLSRDLNGNGNVGREEKCFFLMLILSISLLWLLPVCFYFRCNSVDSSVSSWTKWWTLLLEMLATFWRQRGNGAVEVSFESRTAQMSALFHIFMCAFCLL